MCVPAVNKKQHTHTKMSSVRSNLASIFNADLHSETCSDETFFNFGDISKT